MFEYLYLWYTELGKWSQKKKKNQNKLTQLKFIILYASILLIPDTV